MSAAGALYSEVAYPVGLVAEDSAEIADDVDDAKDEAPLAAHGNIFSLAMSELAFQQTRAIA